MSEQTMTYKVRVHNEGSYGLWAEVEDLPGCFAAGTDEKELRESLAEAIGLYLSDEGHHVEVRLADGHEVESVREERVLVTG